MDKLIEKLGLSDVFAYVCPGAIVMCSARLWVAPDFDSPLWDQKFAVGAIAFIVSYTLGLLMDAINHTAQEQHLRGTQWTRGYTGIVRKSLRLLYSFPSPVITPAIVDLNLRIAEDLSRLTGLAGLSKLVSTTDWLSLYRALASDDRGERAKATIEETEAFHRRSAFCMGVALAALLVSLEITLRLVLTVSTSVDLPPAGKVSLLVLLVLGVISSFVLRHVAIRMRELERYLIASLARRR